MTQADATRALAPAVILVRPQLAVNIGTTARAMANFGLSDLRLVAPREGWPPVEPHKGAAEAAASGAIGLLGTARVFDTTQAAIADLHRVYATTARERGQGKPIMTPSAAMSDDVSALAPDAKVGILFGPERTGLDNDDVVLADAVITFPVDQAYGSLNLAQAVLLVAYEWFKAARGDHAPFGPVEHSKPAVKNDVMSLFDFLEEELTKAGYFRPEEKMPIMRRNLRNILQRSVLSEQDVRTLRGVIVRLIEGPRLPGRRRELRRNLENRSPAGD
ncbi:RNA methyltransferase [Lichenifustis flavocetrariae]|uniref:RNA methyltransferase n=1 Tax=Lichenifustis flavocetrariae TaxID=2949735 RepID=A0AA41YTE0_9HYPH|nr:RNA methyltransferase [Lichenifustis flavocetrariae]MCW6506478.1 RNA methyltransferase [Lichenifustis flavocetrariae]